MDYCDLSGFHLLDQVSDHEILSTALRSHEDKGVSLVQPGLDKIDVSLDVHSLHNRRRLWIFQVVNLNIRLRVLYKRHPVLSLLIEIVLEDIFRINSLLS